VLPGFDRVSGRMLVRRRVIGDGSGRVFNGMTIVAMTGIGMPGIGMTGIGMTGIDMTIIGLLSGGMIAFRCIAMSRGLHQDHFNLDRFRRRVGHDCPEFLTIACAKIACRH